MPVQKTDVSKEKGKLYNIVIIITTISPILKWKGFRFLFLLIRNVNYTLVDILFKMRTSVVGGTGARKDSERLRGARSN